MPNATPHRTTRRGTGSRPHRTDREAPSRPTVSAASASTRVTRRQKTGVNSTRPRSNARTTARAAASAPVATAPRRPPSQQQARAARATSDAAATPPRRRTAHIDALDGLRTLAIAAVVLYHLSVPWLPSGHMGVVVFLVLTGYLVTSSLLRAKRRDGHMNLPRFWGKRLLRIWPPMAVAIAGTVLACMICNHILLTKLKPDLVPSLLLFSNIAAIARGASYFDNLGGTSPLTHLWYLGLDAQFCLVWPCLVWLGSRLGLGHRRTVTRRATLGLAIASAVAMAVLFDPNGDPTRVYYGLDTRAFAPLLGAWLALAWPLGTRPRPLARGLGVPTHGELSLAGIAGLVGLVLIMALAPATGAFLYRGGMLLASVCAVAIIASLLNRKTVTTRLFSWRPLVWLGKRSFGVYLWHFPLFQLVHATDAATPWWAVLLAVVASVALAELSLRLIERPLAQGWLSNQLSGLRSRDGNRRARAQRSLGTTAATVAALAVAIALGVNLIPDETAIPQDALNNTGAAANQAQDLTATSASNDSTDGSSSNGTQSDASDSSSTDTGIFLHASEQETSANQRDPFVIADSVAGDTAWYFNKHCPNGYLDSYVGRQPSQGLEVLQGYLDQGVVGKIVVLACFSNGVGTSDVYEDLVSACGDRQVYLVNAHIPQKEKTQINDALKSLADEHDNVHLIDWDSYVSGHTDEWLYADGTHLQPVAQPEYIDMITNAIRDDFVNVAGGTVEESTDEQKKADATQAATGVDPDTGAANTSAASSSDTTDTGTAT